MEVQRTITNDDILELLGQVRDPELPFLSIVDMGIVTDITINNDKVSITVTPTFVGCPALEMIQQNIKERLAALPISQIEVMVDYSTPWSTNRLSERARTALAEHGFAPPPRFEGDFEPQVLLNAPCPYCGSTNTTLRSPFGPALCRALYYCNSCHQAFEQFKPL